MSHFYSWKFKSTKKALAEKEKKQAEEDALKAEEAKKKEAEAKAIKVYISRLIVSLLFMVSTLPIVKFRSSASLKLNS